jgi:endonuclease G
VAGTSTNGANLTARGYLRLIPESGKAKEGDFVSIIQHPDGAAMQIALRENEVTRADETEPFIWYHADTAHGSSGAPVFNDSFQIVALHASGRIRRNAQGQYARTDGTWVQSLDGLAETDVIWEANVGYRISRICAALTAQAPARSPQYAEILAKAMRGGDVLSVAVDNIKSNVNEREAKLPAAGASSLMATVPQSSRPMQTIAANGPVTVQITVDIGSGLASVAGGPTTLNTEGALETEKFEMRIPVIYDRLDERKGFDPRFLELTSGKDAPAPKQTAAGKALLSPRLDNAGTELKYNHFSVWIQKERRLALNTASNVDWRARKKVVDGKSTSRASLAGFPPKGSFAEQWVNDPRIAAGDQLPDTFYSDDRGAFDKGHIVRRDDVCWGETFEDIQMANGDTYHVTNCSPQIKAFNQGQAGEDNWGDLESHIQKATKTDHEKAIIYAGPVFSPDDRWFQGKDDSGGARIQIPSRFWKIVVVKGANGAAEAYGFVLSQDVRSITETEFYITEDWIGALKPISEIDGLLRGWLSLKDLIPVDHYQQARAALTS